MTKPTETDRRQTWRTFIVIAVEAALILAVVTVVVLATA